MQPQQKDADKVEKYVLAQKIKRLCRVERAQITGLGSCGNEPGKDVT
jgi:hypothetical protein